MTIFGCTFDDACDYDPLATVDDGSCSYPDYGFDCEGVCFLDVDCSGACGGDATYDACGICDGPGPWEICDDGSTVCDISECVSAVVYGCTDSTACNFDASATFDDGTCTFADGLFDCDGLCTVDTDCAGECGGSATTDCAGECGGSATTDCAGECGGSATTERRRMRRLSHNRLRRRMRRLSLQPIAPENAAAQPRQTAPENAAAQPRQTAPENAAAPLPLMSAASAMDRARHGLLTAMAQHV